jgi:hypothetical protein
MAVPVLVIRLGYDGRLSILSTASSARGGAFEEDNAAIVRLHNEEKRSEQTGVIKSPSRQESRRRTKRGFAGRPHEVAVHALAML